MKEFIKYYPELCDSSTIRPAGRNNNKDLIMDTTPSPASIDGFPSAKTPSPLCLFPSVPYSPPFVITPNESFENEPPTEILPFLYVGNAKDSTNHGLLRQLGIRYILSVTNNSNNSSSSLGRDKYESSCYTACKEEPTESPEFFKKHIPVSDNLCENLAPYFEDAYQFIGKFNK